MVPLYKEMFCLQPKGESVAGILCKNNPPRYYFADWDCMLDLAMPKTRVIVSKKQAQAFFSVFFPKVRMGTATVLTQHCGYEMLHVQLIQHNMLQMQTVHPCNVTLDGCNNLINYPYFQL